ncbi:MAG: MarR family transcriptional regulator [Actinomycetota bacterium]
MQATGTAELQAGKDRDVSAEARETAARLGAFLRYLFAFDRGEHLRTIDQSGLTLTQCKALFLLTGPGGEEAQLTGSEIAEQLGISHAALSRALDGLVRKRLVKRVEDRSDRRVRRIAASEKGRELAGTLMQTRMAGLESFAASLSAAERRKLDAAFEALLSREEIAATYAQIKKARR